MRENNMVAQLLDFDRAKVRKQDAVISWKAIAFEVGVSEDTIQRFCRTMKIVLPRWGSSRATRSPVFLPKGRIAILKTLYFA